tara:strand:- start:44586 stop:45629 length:1044 start_codon:yes stop_codon:yes gene_type:complete
MSEDKLFDIRVLDLFSLNGCDFEFINEGLINHTWLVRKKGKPKSVIQRLNKIFPADINEDIDNVTKYFINNDFTTPKIIPNINGELFSKLDECIWRQLSYINGNTYNSIKNEKQARSAGSLLGNFHKILNNFDYEFCVEKNISHDVFIRIEQLKETLKTKKDHRNIYEIKEISDQIIQISSKVPDIKVIQKKKTHGDPKITNIIFNGDDAVSFIDLDTLGEMPIYHEIGDALRSWCNLRSEDSKDSALSLSFFTNIIEGYVEGSKGLLSEYEYKHISLSFFMITLELSARFCIDALNESYFHWDDTSFSSASDHNIIRSKGQLNLAIQIEKNLDFLNNHTLKAFMQK